MSITEPGRHDIDSVGITLKVPEILVQWQELSAEGEKALGQRDDVSFSLWLLMPLLIFNDQHGFETGR